VKVAILGSGFGLYGYLPALHAPTASLSSRTITIDLADTLVMARSLAGRRNSARSHH